MQVPNGLVRPGRVRVRWGRLGAELGEHPNAEVDPLGRALVARAGVDLGASEGAERNRFETGERVRGW
jgi:hypothetical protein